MFRYDRNNLDKSSSPYLQQHKDNPIWWQEWSNEVLDYAKKENKLLFVSIGYATCHWCHVMAKEAFSNKEIAEYLNKNFVSIKVDREQRPDIDQYCMNYLMHSQGQGGWPLNVFMTADKKPVYALTYAGVEAKYGMPGFLTILRAINEGSMREHNHEFVPVVEKTPNIAEENIIATISQNFDKEYGGFGNRMKFPPHCALLYLLYTQNEEATGGIVKKTLDSMAMSGLHDHLQGGFYRYCTDREWTIPHFEKMLYDQAMLLWVYSAAYHKYKKEEYKTVAKGIPRCLIETFEHDGLYVSAHDADTTHEEGLTYVWDEKELQASLTKGEYNTFNQIYSLEKNFEGMIHLTKKEFVFLPDIEKKLLSIRKIRTQPFTDKKIVTSWNALTGIALIHAHRYLQDEASLRKASILFTKLVENHYFDGKLVHSSLYDQVQEQEFLEDYAAMLLFATYLHEETQEHEDFIASLTKRILQFKKEVWIESNNTDFREVAAQQHDHPGPASSSLAELALLRKKILLKEDYDELSFGSPLSQDFLNMVASFSQGNLHVYHSPQPLSWKDLPLNSMQVRDKERMECYKGVCNKIN